MQPLDAMKVVLLALLIWDCSEGVEEVSQTPHLEGA